MEIYNVFIAPDGQPWGDAVFQVRAETPELAYAEACSIAHFHTTLPEYSVGVSEVAREGCGFVGSEYAEDQRGVRL